jgi:hypothetical protein
VPPARPRPAAPKPRLARLASPPRLLALILTVQAALSLRLVWSIGAYGDEGLYIWAGHLEWAHWLHGSPTPDFGAYLSGAPAVYPPLAALADSVGGLAAARGLSVVFMMAATVVLYRVTVRFFTPAAGLCAAMLFAGASAPQFLGAFATYDAMAICFLAAATWLGVEAALRKRLAAQAGLLIVAAVALTVADAAKYVALLFDPVVIAVTGCAFWQARARLRAGVAATAASLSLVALFLGMALAHAPRSYMSGIEFTTLSRQTGSFPAWDILLVAAGWSGLIALLAVLGLVAVACTWRDAATRATGIILAGAPLLVPAAAAHAHLFVSLFKHVGYGEWFGSVLAGYALASFVRTVPPGKFWGAIRVAGMVGAAGAVLGFLLAGNQYGNIGPDFNLVLPQVRAALAASAHPVVASDDVNVTQYYVSDLGSSAQVVAVAPNPQWARADPDQVLQYGSASGDGAYPAAISHGYLAAVILSGFHLWSLADNAVRHDLIASGHYRLAASVPYVSDRQRSDYQVWVLR